MISNRLLSPVTAALNIREEYHKDVEKRLNSIELGDDALNQIVTDIFAKDDIYFSLNRAYEHIAPSFAEYCREHKLHSSLPERFPEFRGKSLYKHQAQAIESIQKGQTTIISTGTGSGKTESFLIPILHYCLVEKEKNTPGIKAVLLYPLNALANDQIHRIIKAVKDTGIRVGCFVRSTPQNKKRTSSDLQEKCISRQEMRDNPPDILITNYVMLDRLITRPEDRSMFVSSAKTLKYIVVDEVHYFRGTRGANLSLLLRRFRLLSEHSLVQIGASGTLRRGGGYFPDSKQDCIERFARLIFGNEAVTRNGFQLIEPKFKSPKDDEVLEPLPTTDTIEGKAFIDELSKSSAERLYEQLSGKLVEKQHVRNTDFSKTPMYLFAIRSPFISAMRKKMWERSCTFNDFVELFRKSYIDVHGKEPRNPRMVVEAYWSLINYLNHRGGENHTPLILDYRLHIILGNVGDELTRCLLCKRYHDGRCPRCRHCSNGLLFNVSQKYPHLCVAYLAGQDLFPAPPPGYRHLPVLVQVSHGQVQTDSPLTRLGLEPNLDSITEEESYSLRLAHDDEEGIFIRLASSKQEIEALSLSEPRMYWHNVMKVVDALVVNPEKKITEKLLGFIDNRERASAIKLRLSDEIADRTLSSWAVEKWSGVEGMNLVEAFHVLKMAVPLPPGSNDEDEARNGPLREMPFWFKRMLSCLDEYEEWKISIELNSSIQADEYELLAIMLREGAIDRTSFRVGETDSLKYFHLEKYRVITEYGVGLSSTDERDYDIRSLGEQGRHYREFIVRVGSPSIQKMLDCLTAQGILIQKTTLRGISFYQLRPEHLFVKVRRETTKDWSREFATVECHTADHSDEYRAQIEARFSDTKIQALICTPTLEMGVDIGKLTSVLMIGFPPSPANYAQRAGRAGRSDKSRLATIVILSSPEDPHDEYYYALPQKMIDGEVTPPQFTLTNFTLLAAHIYAYLSANAKSLSFLSDSMILKNRIRDFLEHDELNLRGELREIYSQFGEYLEKNSQAVAARLKGEEHISIDRCYKLGIFPDYGFRSDGLPLLNHHAVESENEVDDRLLTTREPEAAARKLVPGRIIFCGGRAVKIKENQPGDAYLFKTDPANKLYRLYRYVVANEKDEANILKYRDPESLYSTSRFLDVRRPLESLDMQGPLYCPVYLVHRGELFFINEGKIQQENKPFQPLSDQKGDYRFGTHLERDGLLIRFADRILPPDMKANFLAALLRGIPNCFELDDNELRVAQNLRLYPQADSETYQSTNYFIYGHDESGLVPFKHIFSNLTEVLNETLYTLEHCSCGGSGCYLCLFSLNSRVLTGRISSEGAINCLSVFLRRSLLKPHITPARSVMIQPEIILRLSVNANQCRIAVQSAMGGANEEYTRRTPQENYNTRIYAALHEVLEREWHNGARTVKICTNIEYIRKQLLGENDIDKGREAFLALRLALLKWHNWEVERE